MPGGTCGTTTVSFAAADWPGTNWAPLPSHKGNTTMARGVRSTAAVLARAAAAGVEMPIAEQVQAVLDGTRTPEAAVASLMMREAKSELDGIRLVG